MTTIEIGSAAAGGHDDEFDEFDDAFGASDPAVVPAAAAPTHAVPPPASTEAATALAAQAARDREAMEAAAAEAARRASAAAEEEAQRVAAAEAAAAEAAAAEEAARAAALAAERQAALAAVRAQASGGGGGGGGGGAAHESKTAAERADDAFLASRKNNFAIAEDDEEEGGDEWGAATAAVDEAAEAAAAEAAAAAAAAAREEKRVARLNAQFEAATQAADESREAKAAAKQMRRDGDLSATVIRYTEASAAMCDGPEVSAALASIVGVYREDFSEAPCLQKLLPFTRPKLKDPRLAAARDRLLAAARVPMGDAPLHERILMSLYAPGRVSNAAGGARPTRAAPQLHHRSSSSLYRRYIFLTGDATFPPRYGEHWDVIGFQGQDPATDLRGAGVLSLLQALHFAGKRPELMRAIFKLASDKSDGRDFPFMTVSINMTHVTIQALRSGWLHGRIAKSRAAYDVVHSFYEACFLHLYRAWRRNGYTIRDFDAAKKEVQAAARKKPGWLLDQLEGWRGAAATDGFVELA